MIRIGDFERLACVVGAPRCGTTTLSYFLKKHASVCFPFVKEPHFFAQHDFTALRTDQLERLVQMEYVDRFFGHCPPGRRVAADASVTYLYSPEGMEALLRLWPESRFVIAVRDPLDMLPSLHNRLIYLGDENILRFEDAWSAIPERAAGRRIPPSCVEPRWLRYDEAARFGTHVERFFSIVGRERCLVVVFDDLAADPRGQYEKVMRFFGLEPLDGIDLGRRRQSHRVRVPWLQRLLKRPPRALRQYLAGQHYRQRERDLDDGDDARAGGVDKLFAIRKRLLQWNRQPLVHRQVALSVQRDISRQLRPEIDKLAKLIGRDLGHWLQPRT